MSETISIQQINALKNEFKQYLRATHVEWSDNTILTTNSDAFFALNNNVGIDFWSSFEGEEAMKNLRNKIRDYLKTEKSSPNAEDRANGYLASFRHLKEFLDKMKPSLAKEWQGKVVSVENLRADFQQWMEAQ